MAAKSTVTVRSLAAELGVSPITVSRALRGHDSVRPELAAKVRKVAGRRGYRADPLVSEVMGGLGRAKGARYRETIAFVWTHELSAFASSFEERGARAAAEALGYRVETMKPWTQGLAEHDVSRILWARGIRGVLIAPNYSRPDPRYELEWEKFAAVLLGSSLVNTGLTRVARDCYHDAKLALTRLRAEGFVRVGMALDTSMHERTDRRYAAAFHEYGGELGKGSGLHLVDTDRPKAEERARFVAWLKRERLDAVLTDFTDADDWVPAKLPRARLVIRPGETGRGVRADFERQGAEAMRALDGLLRANLTGLLDAAASILVPGIWEGASTVDRV